MLAQLLGHPPKGLHQSGHPPARLLEWLLLQFVD